MPDFSTYVIRDSRPVGGLSDVVTIGLGPGVIGGQLNIGGNFVGTLSFTSDPGTGTFGAQSLTSLSGTTATTFVSTGVNANSAAFLIPNGIQSLKVTMTVFTSGVANLNWFYSAYNSPPERDLRGNRAARRAAIWAESQGYFVETFSRQTVVSTAVLTSGTVYFTAVPLLQGDIVSGMAVDVNTVGTGITLQKSGLYDMAGNRLAVSADASTTFNATTGTKTMSMSTAYLVPTDGLYHATSLGVTGTTMAGLARSSGSVGATNVGVGTQVARGIQSGQTDLNATHTITSNTGSAVAVWMGLF